MHKAVFLDRDGTIVDDVGYLNTPKDIKVLPGVIEAIRLLNTAGYKVVVITNQAGVARGLITEDMVQTIDKNIHRSLLNGGAHLDGMYYCPHHPEHGTYPYKQECDCRKPNAGMIKKAQKDLNIDLSQSWMVGDKATDIGVGKKAGTKTIFVLTGKGPQEKAALTEKPDHIANDLLDAVKWILKP